MRRGNSAWRWNVSVSKTWPATPKRSNPPAKPPPEIEVFNCNLRSLLRSHSAFTIWTLTARFRLRVKSSDSRAGSATDHWRHGGCQPAEAKGHAGHDPEKPRQAASAVRAGN